MRREPLNVIDGLLTDALGERYGRIAARVVSHGAAERQAHLVDARGVTRTWSVTFLARPMPPALRGVNADIRAGALVGEAFRNRGFTIRKNVIDVFVVEVPGWLREAFQDSSRYAWARIFEFHARKGKARPLIYGTLCEVFTPDFKPPIVTPADVSWLGPATPEFQALGLSAEKAWERIGKLDEGRDVGSRVFRARVATLPRVHALRGRVTEILAAPARGGSGRRA
jgi:hypothetical protein